MELQVWFTRIFASNTCTQLYGIINLIKSMRITRADYLRLWVKVNTYMVAVKKSLNHANQDNSKIQDKEHEKIIRNHDMQVEPRHLWRKESQYCAICHWSSQNNI